jgi:hypothetical protein
LQAELLEFDGAQKPNILVAIRGAIYDVSEKHEFYGTRPCLHRKYQKILNLRSSQCRRVAHRSVHERASERASGCTCACACVRTLISACAAGPGGPYSAFAGRDASRLLAKVTALITLAHDRTHHARAQRSCARVMRTARAHGCVRESECAKVRQPGARVWMGVGERVSACMFARVSEQVPVFARVRARERVCVCVL